VPAGFERDVLVIGGGPAGTTAAQLLASWGWSVLLVHRHDPGAHSLAESLPPSTRKLLQFLGQLDRVEASRPYPNTGNLVHWAGETRATKPSDSGFHVSRQTFDAVLRAGAEAHGVQVVDAVVRGVDTDDPIRVTYTTRNGERRVCHAGFVLDCSGRAGIVARRGLRRLHRRARTLAIVAEYECTGWPVDERTMTTVESYADGWAWSVPLSDTRRQATVMVAHAAEAAPPAGRSAGAFALQARYESELARATALAARLRGSPRVSGPWTCDSSLYDCSRAADGRMLLVGDAASFIEPLSSAGVRKALLSAWRAAVVTNTCLANSSMERAAIDLHIRREREVHAECVRTTSPFFAEAAAAYGTPFWQRRVMSGSTATASDAGVSDEAFSDEPRIEGDEIRDAFDQLRRAGRVQPSPQLRFAPMPVIAGREVVMRDAILVPGSDTPLQFAAGVDLATLARIASTCADVPAIIDAYQRRVGAVPAAGLLTGLSVLVARHALVPEDSNV
jgi:flavin-dependent dehydrogenase